jgi:hypothetical protein
MLNMYIFTCIRIRPSFRHGCREQFLMHIKAVSLKEDISFFCGDRNKWRTCAKKKAMNTRVIGKYGEYL